MQRTDLQDTSIEMHQKLVELLRARGQNGPPKRRLRWSTRAACFLWKSFDFAYPAEWCDHFGVVKDLIFAKPQVVLP